MTNLVINSKLTNSCPLFAISNIAQIRSLTYITHVPTPKDHAQTHIFNLEPNNCCPPAGASFLRLGALNMITRLKFSLSYSNSLNHLGSAAFRNPTICARWKFFEHFQRNILSAAARQQPFEPNSWCLWARRAGWLTGCHEYWFPFQFKHWQISADVAGGCRRLFRRHWWEKYASPAGECTWNFPTVNGCWQPRRNENAICILGCGLSFESF